MGIQNVKISEVVAMLRMVHHLHTATDPTTRKRRLIEGLCALFGGSFGACQILDQRHAAEPKVVSSVFYPADGDRYAALVGNATSASTAHRLDSMLLLPDSTIAARVQISRPPDVGVRFTRRQRQLIHLVHTETIWVYQPDLLLNSADAMGLSPRTRQTLAHLLAGLSEKQIAAKLGLSPNTIHHYVKLIHRHFCVSSRSELLARWVGRVIAPYRQRDAAPQTTTKF